MSASSAVKTRRTTPSRGVSRNITGTMQKGKEDVQKLYTIAETSGQRSKETTTGKKDATKLAPKIKKAAKNEEKEEKREAEKETSTGKPTAIRREKESSAKKKKLKVRKMACYKFGHMAQHCKGKEVCFRCGQQHGKDVLCSGLSCTNCGATAALQMHPYASGAAAVATLMACELANLTAADAVAVAAAAAVAPAGDDHGDDDGFLMPRRGTRSQLIASWTPVHEELDDAATPRHCHDAGNWTLDVDVKDVGRLLLLLLLLIQMPPGEDPSAVKTAF
ncbi:hypothetical protein ACLKA6_008430 [Drosophila palustris]